MKGMPVVREDMAHNPGRVVNGSHWLYFKKDLQHQPTHLTSSAIGMMRKGTTFFAKGANGISHGLDDQK